MRQPPNPAVYEMAEGLRSAGATWQEVADILGVHYVTVYRWKREGFVKDIPFVEDEPVVMRKPQGRPGVRWALTDDQIAQARVLREQGVSFREIGRRVGADKETIRLNLKQEAVT